MDDCGPTASPKHDPNPRIGERVVLDQVPAHLIIEMDAMDVWCLQGDRRAIVHNPFKMVPSNRVAPIRPRAPRIKRPRVSAFGAQLGKIVYFLLIIHFIFSF